MKNITTNIPDTLLRQAQAIALALASQVSVGETRASFAVRSQQGDWQKAQGILAKAPNNEPEAADQL